MNNASTPVCRLDFNMLRNIDGISWNRVEFEERARLRTLRVWGVRVTRDEAHVVRVDWSSVREPLTPATR